MSVTLFLTLLSIESVVIGLVTEALKKGFRNAGKNPSANLIALINAVVVGGGGTIIYYVLMGIAFTPINIVCIILMIFATAISAMVGYDKTVQTIIQITSKETK